jgi:hypothetical protein
MGRIWFLNFQLSNSHYCLISILWISRILNAHSNSFRFQSLRALHIQNLSNHCRHKYDPSISRIFQSNFWQVFDVWHNCAVLTETMLYSSMGAHSHRQRRVRRCRRRQAMLLNETVQWKSFNCEVSGQSHTLLFL